MSKIMSYTIETKISTKTTCDKSQKAKTIDDFLSYMDRHFYNMKKVDKGGKALKRLFL